MARIVNTILSEAIVDRAADIEIAPEPWSGSLPEDWNLKLKAWSGSADSRLLDMRRDLLESSRMFRSLAPADTPVLFVARFRDDRLNCSDGRVRQRGGRPHGEVEHCSA